MKFFCLSTFIPLLVSVQAFSDAHNINGEELFTRNYDGLVSFKARDLASIQQLRLVTRATRQAQPNHLVKRGGCVGKACMKPRPSGDQQPRQQSPSGRPPSPGPSRQGGGGSSSSNGGQVSIPRLNAYRPEQRQASPGRSSSSSSPRRSSSSEYLVSGADVRWGSLARDSPSWDATRPRRASSHAAQAFTSSLRNNQTPPTSPFAEHGSGERIGVGHPTTRAGSRSGADSASPPDSGQTSGAVSVSGRQ